MLDFSHWLFETFPTLLFQENTLQDHPRGLAVGQRLDRVAEELDTD